MATPINAYVLLWPSTYHIALIISGI